MKNITLTLINFLLIAGVCQAEMLYSNTFTTDPSADFTSYNNGIVFSSSGGKISATRGDNRVGWYQLTAANTEISNGTLRSLVNLTKGNPNNGYAVLMGITARAQAGETTYDNGYYATIGAPSYDSDVSTFVLRLGRDMQTALDGNNVEMGTVLATGTYAASYGTDYLIELEMEGTTITATLLSADGLTQHDQISATDSTYSSGQCGYVAGIRSSSSSATFDNIELSSGGAGSLIGTVYFIE